MTGAVPPVPPAGPAGASSTPSSSGATPVEASIGNAPDRIQQLAHQIQVSGVLTSAPDGGGITLNTVLGNLNIVLPALTNAQQDKLIQQLTALFDSQKPLTVVVQPGNPPTQAFLLLPSSSNTSQGVAPPGITQTNILQQAIQPAVSPQSLHPLQTGTILSAVVLPANTSAPVIPGIPGDPVAELPLAVLDEAAAKAVLTAGQALSDTQGQILAPGLPQTPSMPVAGMPVAPAVPTPLSPALSSVVPVNLQPGMEITLTVNAVAPPGTSLPAPALPNQISATVLGTGPNGQLLVQAGNATFYVKQGADAAVGSSLLLTVSPGRADIPTPLPMPDAGSFGALQQALAALAQASPDLARQVMETIIPQPGAALGGALLFFLSAFRQADAPAWFGVGASDALAKAGKMELIARLAQELGGPASTVSDPVVGSWKSYPVPLYNNGQFQVLHFYVHNEGHGGQGGKQGEKESAGGGAKSVRFLIDMRLSKLGALQLDGFVRAKQLDMMIRSENILPPGLDRDLRQGYAHTLSSIGYAGALNFQTGRQHWLHIKDPARAGSMVT